MLQLNPADLVDIAAHRRGKREDMIKSFKELNQHNRNNYAEFIKQVGRNLYPVIIATDHDDEIGTGVGTTFILHQEDGSEMKITPALNTFYVLYKSVCHTLLGLTVILCPYLKNPSSSGWMEPLIQYKKKLVKAFDSLDAYEGCDLSPTIVELLESVLDYVDKLIDTKTFTLNEWTNFNESNFPKVKHLMGLATDTQADANVAAMLKWKEMLGPKQWSQTYVVIPTVWPVGGHNPRMELFRNLFDEDKLNTNIIMSEWPRNNGECRTLLGRAVGDRAVGRFVFGVGTPEQEMKTVGLSTGVDVVSDDAIPALYKALIKRGIRPREFLAQ